MVKLSIIIASRDRTEMLKESVMYALDSIEGFEAEIIIVNDGTRPLIDSIYQHSNITLLDNQQRGVSAARNFGASYAMGQWLLFLDDDMWLNKDAVKWIFANSELMSERFVFNLNWQYPQRLIEKLHYSKVGRYILSKKYHTMAGRMYSHSGDFRSGVAGCNSISSCSLLISKDNFSRINGYNEDIRFQGEDIDLSNRLLNGGFKIFCVFDVQLHHNHSDRIQLEDYLERLRRGYNSQFLAEKERLIPPSESERRFVIHQYHKASMRARSFLTWMFYLIPDNRLFTPISNRLLGTLGTGLKFSERHAVFNANEI